MNYWMIVTSPDNFHKSKELDFTVQGMKSRHRKKAERMKSGDLFVYYLTKRAAFGGICQIESDYFEDHSLIWSVPKKPDEHYPWRVKISAVTILPDELQVPAADLKDQLDYVKKWPADHWRLAFQGNVHNLPEKDFNLIQQAVESAPMPVSG